MKDRFKILFIIDDLTSGGAQRQLSCLVSRVNRDLFDVNVCSLGKENEYFVEEIKKTGIAMFTISQYGKLDPACLFKLVRLIRRIRPDIVETILFTADSYGRIAAVLTGVPVIVSSQRSVGFWKEGRHLLADRILSRFTKGYIANSEAAKAFLVGRLSITPGIISVIYNGIELSAISHTCDRLKVRKDLDIPSSGFIVGMVARFELVKDHRTFMNMAKMILDKREDVHFVLVGDGPLRADMEDLARCWKIDGKISFLGRRRDVYRVYTALDISVLTSSFESCSNVIMESMAAGRPVVAADVGGNPEIVKEGKTGLLFESGNAGDLAQKVLHLAENPGMAEEMGITGRNRLEKSFTVSNMITRTEGFYRKLLETGHKERNKT
ncbi:glycosyltransferase [Candidatus Omnitrophota bacterium]